MSDFDFSNISILIVDDNKHMRVLVKALVHAFGVRKVSEASDGADGLKELRHSGADIVICDWAMAPLDGIDFTRLVRSGKDSPNPYVPIVMLTGHTATQRVAEARDAGVNEFLAKPLSAAALYSRLAEIIANPRPFIRTPTYFGPDRRRKQEPYEGLDRRKNGVDDLDPDKIAALLNSGS